MSLYDDDDVTDKTASSGWSSGIKMMQSQLAFKKATITVQPKRDHGRRKQSDTTLPPVIDLKSRKDEEENLPPYLMGLTPAKGDSSRFGLREVNADPEWKFANEYDPYWPNDYEKVVKEIREKREREEMEQRKQEREDREKRRRERDRDDNSFSSNRESIMEEEEERDRSRRPVSSGAAIAPPPSLSDSPPPNIVMPQNVSINTQRSASFGGYGSSVAAKIMAKYGFREGQGLGKSQQGIVKALEVEKTSKRGGRIVAENEGGGSPPPTSDGAPSFSAMPPPPMPPPPKPVDKSEQSMVNVLKNPSKVAILLNMVGPGEVDDELEPEVREECSLKYGPVIKVMIYEIPNVIPDEAVRIFVEFQRMESAVKAVIDLNGRFFGGRQVKAGFYEYENFKAYKLNENFLS